MRRLLKVGVLGGIASAFVTGAFALASCSDDVAGAAPESDAAESDAKKKPAPWDEDSGEDEPTKRKPSVDLPTCVGTGVPMSVSGVRAFVPVGVGANGDGGYEGTGQFVVDFGSIGSTIDLAAYPDGGAPTPVDCNGDAAAPGALCHFHGFDFFGDWGDVYLTTANHSTLFGVRQAGILATDFLARAPVALDFTKQTIHRTKIETFCTDAQLLGAGFRPLPAGGFYTNDTAKLRPLSEVLSEPDASAGFVVPNVPTVPITLGGTAALAQLDTGYEDRIARNSLNINVALFQALSATPDLLARDAMLDLFVTTCVPGLSEKLEGYRIADGKVLEFIGEGGAVARVDKPIAVYLKQRSDATFRCGGISTWTVPAAQIGASFFIDAQALVVDPVSSRVWVPKND